VHHPHREDHPHAPDENGIVKVTKLENEVSNMIFAGTSVPEVCPYTGPGTGAGSHNAGAGGGTDTGEDSTISNQMGINSKLVEEYSKMPFQTRWG
jgi:hypothetical protein